MSDTGSRVIVITGATRGCGRALVECFAAAGHRVAGCGRSAEGIAELRRRYDGSHRFDVVSVADDRAVGDWAEQVTSTLGPPDLLLNNAALINESAPLWEVPAEEFSTLIDVNVKGVVNVIRHFVPPMIARGRGVVVNMSSGWGRTTSPRVAPYCASKWAIEGLSRSLAQELPRGLASIALNPGIIHTEMLDRCFGGSAGGYPSPQEWAERAAPFLLKLAAADNGKAMSVPSRG